MTKPLQDLKKIEIPVGDLLICEKVDQTISNSSKSESSDITPHISQQNNIFYQKITPNKSEKLDIEAIIAEYNMTSSKNNLKQQKKEKPKNLNKKPKLEVNKMSFVQKMIVSQDSILLINSFMRILNEKFSGSMNQLMKERKTCLERLFNYLCFGFQQILDSFKSQPSSINILQSINKQDVLMLLKQRCFAIDLEILNTHKNPKRNQPTLKFKNQWKLILDLLKQPSNSKLRQAIIIDEVQPSQLVYARQIDLIKYLSQERQKKLKFQAQQILRNSETAKDWVLTYTDQQTDQSVQELSESQTSPGQESGQQGKTPNQQSNKVKKKQNSKKRQIQLTDVRPVKKLRKMNENTSLSK